MPVQAQVVAPAALCLPGGASPGWCLVRKGER